MESENKAHKNVLTRKVIIVSVIIVVIGVAFVFAYQGMKNAGWLGAGTTPTTITPTIPTTNTPTSAPTNPPTSATTNAPTSATTDSQTTVSTLTINVKTVKELFDAIGSNRIIQLQPGTYRLDELSDADLVNPYAAMHTDRGEQSLDGAELVIQDVENLTIIGLGESPVEIFTKYQLANVLTFMNTQNIIITNIRAGHSPSQGGCYGGVITFKDSNNVSIHDSEFFGCGINGLELCNVKNVLFDNSVIEDCNFHIMCLSNSEGIIFQNSDFINNNGVTLINISGCKDVVFDECNISDNVAKTDTGVFFTIDFFDFSPYVSSFERNDVISNVTIKNSVIKNNNSVSTDIMRTTNETKDSITFENTVFEGNGFDK